MMSEKLLTVTNECALALIQKENSQNKILKKCQEKIDLLVYEND
jgi:hypothetical protein